MGLHARSIAMASAADMASAVRLGRAAWSVRLMSNVVPIAGKHRRYTKREKVTTVIAAEMSSVAAAAQSAGIPERTVGYWFDAPEFAELRAKTRADLADESKALAHKALGEIKRRIESFEPRDLTILFGVLVDKAQLLAGEATDRLETREIMADFADGEADAIAAWLRDIARERMAAEA